ncbi:hypothetical protein NC653_013436 [Populus alba x Populus x berolinensis]|uniref:Uncharacterized protein n=1 Tax=Populus alba x Populus x berolinensis TaxID=444605 RepID=A0AAD6W307_9ROSI|nr:hypothetical protein NC653_013434 [Populus alba x Populus x berolinensis]KAJ6996848.1 hypothetical protein NC653_013436 [Populus alba x Populus x berolinensis]
MGEECKVLRYDLTSVSKGNISGLTILVGKSPSVSLNGIVNLTIDKKLEYNRLLQIKYEACTDLASLIYSLGYTSESDSELDYTSSPSDFEIMATKEQQDMVANKNSTFTDLDYVIEVIMKQSFNRCETEKEMDACGYEAQVYFSEILDCNMIQDLTANGKWQISTPTTLVSNIPRNDKENGPDNMTVIKEDQQSWPKMNLVHSITLRNGKQIGAIK